MCDEKGLNIYSSKTVCAETQTIKSIYTREMSEDIKSSFTHYVEPENDIYQNLYKRTLLIERYVPIIISAEEELTKILSEELAASIDREIMKTLMDGFQNEL